jgi:hypothetical protein
MVSAEILYSLAEYRQRDCFMIETGVPRPGTDHLMIED